MSMIGQFTPALRADEDVLPFRLIMLNDRGEGRETSALSSVVIGVSDGSNRRFDDANHALSGDPIRLQPGSIVQVEVGDAIPAPGAIRPRAEGSRSPHEAGIGGGRGSDSGTGRRRGHGGHV